ncbi:flagellar basal body rod protein FlgG [compost metagenome]
MVNKETAVSLEKHENSTFTVQGIDIAALPNGTAQIHNYMLENSNVDMTKEMSDMMMNQSLLKASQRVMLSFEKIYEKEANELGK